MDIIAAIKKEDLVECIDTYANYVNIDKSRAYIVCLNAIRYFNTRVVWKGGFAELELLLERWYDSLESGTPDFSVYNDPFYFCDLWLCWVCYSRQYIKDIQSDKSLFGVSIVSDMQNVNTVLDLGCGFGYTTIGLKQAFPNADVFGTNMLESHQYAMAANYGNKHDFTVLPSHDGIKADLIFASEYFEHFANPIEHLLDVLKCKPKYLIIANAFNAKAIGHFNEYYYNDSTYTGKQMSLLFNKTLRANGYTKVKTRCWNDRPYYWKRSDLL